MSFIASCLGDFSQRESVSWLVDAERSERRDIKRRRVSSSTGDTSSDASILIDNIGDAQFNANDGLYRPLVKISSNLDALCGSTIPQSKVSNALLNK